MNDTMVHEDFATRCQKVLQVAKELYHGNPDWVTFFREVLGVSGAARNVFPNQIDYVTFEKSPQHNEIQQMVTNLRNRKIPGGGHNEATRVITVRLPESLHEALKAEASDHKTSMNKLCISKLLQVLLDEAEANANRSAPPARPANPLAANNPMTAPRTAAPTITPNVPTPMNQPSVPLSVNQPNDPNQFRRNY